jgi:hypothetical protein
MEALHKVIVYGKADQDNEIIRVNAVIIKCRRLQSSDAVLAISASILLTISETGIREMLTIFDPVLAIIAACSQSSAPAHAICN